jgi:uncharacterized membrane protein
MTNNIEFDRGAIRPSECISEGWESIKANYWLYFGISVIATIILACVPCVNIFIAGPIMAGVYYCYFRNLRNENVEFGMMFKGFEAFVPTMVCGIIQMVPEIIGQGIRLTVNLADIGSKMNKTGGSREFFQSSDTALASGLIVIGIVVGLGFIIFNIIWRIVFLFAVPILAENPTLSIGETLKLSARAGWANGGMIFVLGLLEGLLILVGFLALCVGFLFVLPVVMAANAVAYRQVFPDRTPQNQMFNTPPPPSAYQNQF